MTQNVKEAMAKEAIMGEFQNSKTGNIALFSKIFLLLFQWVTAKSCHISEIGEAQRYMNPPII